MNTDKSKKLLLCMFYTLFVGCFTLITINMIFNNPYHETAYLLPVTAVCIAGLVFIFKLLGRFEDRLKKDYNIILTVFCLVMLIIQIIAGKMLIFDPAYDMGAVYHGAVDWVNTGTFENYYSYYEWFPNNLGAMVFLYFVFKICSLIGITDYFMIGVTINSLMSICMMATVSLICKKLKGIKYAVFALCIFALSLPFYIIGAVFYTDALSMLFPVLLYYMYLKSKDEDNPKKRIIYYALMGVVGAIGMQIKFTVLIGVIAVMIDMLFNCDYKRFICAAGCSVIIIAAVSMLVNGIIYGNHLDRETARLNNTPYSHWIMMGFHGEGLYNPSDYEFTRSFNDTKERDKAISEEISQTLKELKYNGIFKLYLKKMARDFGDGTYGFSDFLDDSNKKDTSLHEYVLYDGEKYNRYTHYCTSMHIALFCIMVLGAYSVFTGKKKTAQQELAPFVAIFGMMLFLMMWETNRRYFSNFVPMIFICSVLSIDYATAIIKEKFQFVKQITK